MHARVYQDIGVWSSGVFFLESIKYSPRSFSLISLHTDIPSYGCMQECMVCCYTIHNRTNRVMEVECVVKASDAFMLAGNSQVGLFMMFFLISQSEFI